MAAITAAALGHRMHPRHPRGRRLGWDMAGMSAFGSFNCVMPRVSNAALSDPIHTEAAMPTNERMKADVVQSNEPVVIPLVILVRVIQHYCYSFAVV